LYFVALAPPRSSQRPTTAADRSPLLIGCYGAAKAVQFAFPALWVWGVERRRLRLVAPEFRGLTTGLGFGVCVALAILVLYFGVLRDNPIFQHTSATVEAKIHEFGIETPAAFLLFALFLSVVHSLGEEYYWRWFVFGRLRLLIPLAWAMLLSSLAFMAHHVIILGVFFPDHFWTLAVPFSAGVAGGGLVWAWLYQRTNSLYPPWLSHMLVDGAVMAVGFAMVLGSP
jgi:membrane protease YdiL (CAAX protease family)